MAFRCVPNDLFVFSGAAAAGQPVTGLVEKVEPDMSDVAADVPIGKLEAFKKRVEEIKKEL